MSNVISLTLVCWLRRWCYVCIYVSYIFLPVSWQLQ